MNPEQEREDIIICGASQIGKYHERKGIPCQDNWMGENSGDIVVIAVSDGLSSAKCSGTGSKISVRTACESIKFPDLFSDFCICESSVRTIFAQCRKALEEYALAHSSPLQSFACTLILFLWQNNRCVVGHLGDGVVVGKGMDGLKVLSPPEESEYVNETSSLTQQDWKEQLRISEYTGIRSVIISTDGCQSALINKNPKPLPYVPFLEPLLSYIHRHTDDGTDLNKALADLLCSERMSILSPDDKTLVLMTQTMQDVG